MKRSGIVITLVFVFAAMVAGALHAESSVRYYYNGYAATVVLPGQPLRFSFDFWAGSTADIRHSVATHLYRIPTSVRLNWLRHSRYQLTDKEIQLLQLVGTQQPTGVLKDGRYEFAVDFGPQENAEYLLTWDTGDNHNSELFDVGSLGTVWHGSGTSLLVYAVDLRTMRHRSDVRYALLQRDGSRSGLVVFDGLSWLHGAAKTDGVLFGTASDGSITLQQLSASGPQAQAGYVQTDRPIYRPGQRVYLRAILRGGVIGGYSVPHGDQRVLVRGPDGSTIYDKRRPLTGFGTLSTQLDLPQSAPLGQYQVTAGSAFSSFSVEAYKKPEYLLDAKSPKPYVISGDNATFTIDAKYFFGRPAAGMHIHYLAERQAFYWPWYNPYANYVSDINRYRQAEKLAEADAQTDASGQLTVTVATKHLDADDTLNLTVDGRDASGRTVTTQAAVRLVPASFRIDLQPDKWYAQLGDDVNIAIDAKDYESHARSNAALSIVIDGDRWDYSSHKDEKLPIQKSEIATDPNGKAVYRWHPNHAGSYRVHVTGKDERGHTATSTLWFWVSSSNERWWFPNEQITLIPDKQKYRPGEAAKILLTTPQSDADAVLIVSTDHIVAARLLHVGSKPQTVTVQPPKDASTYRVSVEVPGSLGLQTGQVSIQVSPPPRSLVVTLKPDKAKYKPGDRANFAVHVRDVAGKPVRAELGIGVVDESLYAVQEDTAATAMSQFYDSRDYWFASSASWNRVRPMLKEIGTVRGGTTSDVYAVNSAAARSAQGLAGGHPLNSAYSAIASVPARSFFPDTAYWNPELVTDERGNASMSFVWPDTLTTWRASGVAIDMQTDVGAASQQALVTKDFLVRLEMPRFLRRGDVSTFIGIANGQPGVKTASLILNAGDLLGGASAEQNVTLDSTQSGNAAWVVNPSTSLGDRDITLGGTDGALSDALRLTIPIEAAGAAEHLRDAGKARDRNTVSLELPQYYDPGALRITMAPSVVASLVQNVQLLDIYPYYCTEQTMSAALPAVFVDRVLKRTGLQPAQDSPSTATVVNKAIARLRELQHDDGSWGWWETDDGHPYMTAYALYGLSEFRKSGFAVPPAMVDNGTNSLVEQLKKSNDDTLRLWGGRQPGSQWNTRAFMLFALANVAPQRVDRALLAQTMEQAPRLNDYALAVLGLAQHQLHDDAAAHTILDRLNKREVDDGAYTFWLGQTWHYAWEDDPIETTAYALRLNAALDAQSPRISKIVNFLRAQQRGSWWYTTKDTAAAVYAISETIPSESREFHPKEDVKVFVGDKLVDQLHVSKAVLDAKDGSIVVPSSDLQHGANVRFDVSGSGELYWSTDWTRYAPPSARKVQDAEESILSRLRARPSSFSIDRKFNAKRWPWQVGDEITVSTTVSVDTDTDYVAVEDPFPAGVEYQPIQGQAGNNWSGIQFFDDRAVFFADHLSSRYPLHLQYTLRVTTPGQYTAAPPIAYAMYGPPVSAVGQPDRVHVR